MDLSKRVERRIELDFDLQFKPGDEFRWGPDIYVVTSVETGHDRFDAVLFADMVEDRPLP